jgi:phospholipid N-methyltransferase
MLSIVKRRVETARMHGQEAEEVAEPYRSAEAGSFFLNWLQDPFSVGAVAPSSRALAKLMTAGLRPGARVVELGAGTGTVTRAILDCGVAAQDLYVVEQNPQFAAMLERRFPRCEIIVADAVSLSHHRQLAGMEGSMDFVISGLPLLLFNAVQKRRVMEESFAMLKPAGRFHQFTYAGRCSVGRAMLRSLDLKKSLIGISALNLPPAFVYRIERACA